MKTMSKFGLAIVAMALLLWSPVWACAWMPVEHVPSHSCCPDAAGASGDLQKVDCRCVDGFPIQNSALAKSDAPGLVLAEAAVLEAGEFAPSDRVEAAVIVPPDRSVRFRQLLI